MSSTPKHRPSSPTGKKPAPPPSHKAPVKSDKKTAAKPAAAPAAPPAAKDERPSTAELGIPTCRGEVWDRIVRIHVMINRRERFTARDLMTRLGVNRRTIERTLGFMRDQLEMPIIYEPQFESYIYSRSYPYLPVVRVESDEAFVLKLMTQLVPAFVGAQHAETFKRVMKKFSLVVGGSHAFTDSLGHGVVFPFAAPDAAECRYLQIVSDAMDAQLELEVDYQKADATAPETRLVHPLDFAYSKNRWAVLVHDTLRNDARTFRLDRIRGARSTGKRFERPTHYDPAALLRGNFGAYTGREDHEIRLLLSDHAANDARSRKWHHSQVDLERDAGHLEITLRLNNLIDIACQILYWSPHIEILAPAELRTRVREASLAMGAKNSA